MKTININLIGELAKTVKSNRIEIEQDTLDARTRVFVIVFILGTFFILATSFGVWLVTKNLSHRSEIALKRLKTELVELKHEEALLSAYTKDLQNKKKIAELKILAKNQINGLFIPWSLVLKDLSAKVPKNIIVTDIKKAFAGKTVSTLDISGIVSAKEKPLTAVSFFILNINEDKGSLLSNATIKNLDYKKEIDSYEFKIQAQVRKSGAGKNL